VRGCSNFVGYLKRAELDSTDADGWFDTGDLARIDSDGYARITGRSKDIIIRGGENVPVVEIEGLVYKHPSVRDVAIVAMPDERLGERSCAFVTTKAGAAVTLEDLTTFLMAQDISKNYLPEHLEILPELPRTASGKIQKFRLREMAKALKSGQ
jgi:cyclohexanecarboxylate-CoA ligase